MNSEHQFLCDIAENISMPAIYLSVRDLLKNVDSKIKDYVELVQTDSMLSLRIIRIANSDFFGCKRKADDLYDAISLIGSIQLHDLLLSCLCMRTFSNIPASILDSQDFWRHAMKCGIACRTLANVCRLPGANRFFALGLLLEIGHAAMFIKAPDLALDALLNSQETKLPLQQTEREIFGFDYCQLGSELMQIWHMPEVYAQIIGHQLTPETSDDAYRNDTYLVHLAQQLLTAPAESHALISHLKNSRAVFRAVPDNLAELVSAEIDAHLDDVFLMLAPPHLHTGHAAHG